MKTPDEIKKGLVQCSPRFEDRHTITCGKGCPYAKEAFCRTVLHDEVLIYIQQLEETVAKQNEKYKRLLETASILSDAIDEMEE